MHVVVCVKQIPDPSGTYTLDPETHFLVRPDEQVLDDTDRYGVEMGLQIAQAHGGSVTLVSMGPKGSMQGIRQALAMGADRARGGRRRRPQGIGRPDHGPGAGSRHPSAPDSTS